jgi:hypothetical protein
MSEEVLTQWQPATGEKPKIHQLSERELKPDSAAEVRAQIIRVFTSGFPSFDKREEIGKLVVTALRKCGQFFYDIERRDFDSAMFFDFESKELHRIRSDRFVSWFSDWIAIGRGEKYYKAAYYAVENASLLEESSTGTIPEAYWATRPGVIYLSNGDAAMVKITASKVELVDNGTDNVLFPAGQTLAPWELTDPVDPFETCALFKDANCAAPHGLDVIRIWILSLPTNPAHKPPLCKTGEIGSGKTRLSEGICELYGLPFLADSVDDHGEEDFWVSVDGGGLFVLDNCDTKVAWLANAVAAASTGTGKPRRKLYTNSEKIMLRPRAWIGLTTANPTFASDAGLADRLLVVRMKRRTDETADSKLSDEIKSNREGALSFIANALATALADKEPTPQNLNLRHPDFAEMAVRIGRAIGREQETITALSLSEKDKYLFCIENDHVTETLLEFLDTTGSFNGTAAQLREALQTFDNTFIDQRGRPSAKAVGKRLTTLWPHLERVLPVAGVETGRGRVKTYTFGRETDNGDTSITL